MKRYRVHYTQIFSGETLEDSYVRSISDERELINIENSLYQDPHVVGVFFEEIEEGD